MPNFRNCATVNQVANKAMTVRRHGNEIAILSLGRLQDFFGRVAKGQMSGYGQTFMAKLAGDGFKVFAILFHFRGFSQLELVKVAGNPAVGDVNQIQFGVEQLGQVLDMRDEALVRPAVLQCYKNLPIHLCVPFN
jgi:hypothetical protein